MIILYPWGQMSHESSYPYGLKSLSHLHPKYLTWAKACKEGHLLLESLARATAKVYDLFLFSLLV